MALTLFLVLLLISFFISKINIGNRRPISLILSAGLIICFFLPYYGNVWLGATGYSMVFNHKTVTGSWERYIWLLIPVSAILLIIGTVNKETYIINRRFLSLLPLLTLIFICIWLRTGSRSYEILIRWLGYGFWISLAASLLLAFYNSKKDTSIRDQ